jgi:transaldolase
MTAPASSSSATQQLLRLGQSTWLDYISRGLISSGELARMIADGDVVGMTSNPTIFEKALASSKDYDASIRDSALRGVRDPYAAFVDFAADDIRLACDALTATYESMGGQDGFVSLEVPPGIEHDRDATIAEARRLAELVGRPNLMIKVPGTPAGVVALEALIAEGVNVNVTLLFAVGAYEAVAEGYLRGLEARLARGLDLTRVASVASFFVSRVDTAVDALLPADSPLRGTIAVANARRAYGRFQHAPDRWERLAARGTRPASPLGLHGHEEPAYSDILYVEDLVAPFTVNTMPEATFAPSRTTSMSAS